MRDVILACDFSSKEALLELLDKFGTYKPFIKIGMELYYKEGAGLVIELKEKGYKIFLDLKLHDIPNTVYKAMKNIASLGVDMVNCHAAGGVEMMQSAMRGAIDGSITFKRPLVIAVTQLTSTSEAILKEELLIDKPLSDVVKQYAENAKKAGLDGVVCSPLEAPIMKDLKLISVTPGVRPNLANVNDQKRVATPSDARALGSDYIVVGRPITEAADPALAYAEIFEQFTGVKLKDQSETKSKDLLPEVSGICDRNLAISVAKELLDIKAVFLRPSEPFTWASGIKSPIYCDNRMTLANPTSRKIIANGMASVIKRYFPTCEVIMGAATGGIPHATLTAELLNLPSGYVRSDLKSHGRNNQIEGASVNSKKVIVIEDLISTAGSSVEVAKALIEAGATVLAIISIVTYNLKSGIEKLKESKLINISLCDINVLVDVAMDQGYISLKQKEMTLKFVNDPNDSLWMQ
jgi:orotidine 5'-phosphate decarboxylase subfamily 1/orotate phosphoribosyltransferase